MKTSERIQVLGIGFTIITFLIILPLIFQAEAQSREASLKKQNRGGAVTVEVVYMNPIEKNEKKNLIFKVEMNTHSVDLDAYEIEKISFLKNDKGREIKAIAWEQLAGGGHHRSGLLVFSETDDSGIPVVTRETRFIELTIKDLSGVKERVFRWNLN